METHISIGRLCTKLTVEPDSRCENPGAVWNAHPKTAAYRCNTAGEVVLFRISSDGVQRVGRYTSGALYVTRETDEDGIWQESFTDKSGRVVMTRQGNGYDTYYIYDDHGRLCYVLPPDGGGRNV